MYFQKYKKRHSLFTALLSKPHKKDATARKSVVENIVGIKLKKLFHYQILGLDAKKKPAHHVLDPIFGPPSPQHLPPIFHQPQCHQSLHICAEGRLCEWHRNSWPFWYPAHHTTVEKFGGPMPNQSHSSDKMKGIASNTKQACTPTINHDNREGVQCVGSPVSW